MKTVAFYRRSTNIQENSIEMQRQMARNLSYQKALIIDEEFIDDAVSGRTKSILERAGLSALLSKIEKEEVTNLLVYKRDRLTRNALEYLQIFQLLKEKQVNVYFTALNEIPIQYSPAGELIELLMAGIIQREGEQIVERISETIKANFQRGKAPGNLPFGYVYNKQSKTIVRDEDRLQMVKTLFEVVNSNKFITMRNLIDFLKKNNIKREDQNWSSQMVRNIISNPTYMGMRLLNISGEKLKSRYDSLEIVTEMDWNAAQEVLENLLAKKSHIENEKTNYHLKNLVFCKVCNTPLQPKIRTKNKQKNHYYTCNNHNIKVEKKTLEEKVLNSCNQFFTELLKSQLPNFYKRHHEETNKLLQNTLCEVEQNLKKLNKRLVTTTEKWINEKRMYEKEKLEGQLLSLYQIINDEKKQIDSLKNEMLEVKKEIVNKYTIPDTLNFNDTNLGELFHDIVSKVEVEQYTINIVFKHPFLTIKEVLETRVS
jgi:site-specific DNA recombinase